MRMHAMRTGIVIGLGMALGLPQTVVAQVGKSLTLKPSSGTHAEEFTSVISVRELSDGRVLAADQRERRIVVLDFAKQTAEPVGRVGRGPGEYTAVTRLTPAAGDSSIMGDYFQRRFVLFDGARIAGTTPPDHPVVAATEMLIMGSDARGNLLTIKAGDPPSGVSTTTQADSEAVVFVSRTTARMDTVTKLRMVPMRREVTRNGGKITSSMTMIAGEMPAAEQAQLFADGWLAVARLDPFRVDWRAHNGNWLRGAPLPVKRIPVDAREKNLVEAKRAAARAKEKPLPEGFPPMPPRPGAGEFPDFIPPYSWTPSLQAGPAGLLVIKRHPSADYTGSHYFVVDRASKLVGELALPANETIVGAGPKSLYIAVKDEDDVIRLRRHPW